MSQLQILRNLSFPYSKYVLSRLIFFTGKQDWIQCWSHMWSDKCLASGPSTENLEFVHANRWFWWKSHASLHEKDKRMFGISGHGWKTHGTFDASSDARGRQISILSVKYPIGGSGHSRILQWVAKSFEKDLVFRINSILYLYLRFSLPFSQQIFINYYHCFYLYYYYFCYGTWNEL